MSSLNSSNVDSQGIIYSLNSPNTGEATVAGYAGGSDTNIVFPSQVIDTNGSSYTVTAIQQYAFPFNSFVSIVIPNSVLSIGRNAFEWSSTTTSVTIGNSVTSISFAAFYQNTSLTSLTIGTSVTSIGGYAFRNCTSLTSVTIPDSMVLIGQLNGDDTDIDAFADCTSLTSLTLGNSVTTIAPGSFSGTALTSVNIPVSVTSIGANAFPTTTTLVYQPSSTICFPAKTPIMTNQGPVNIEEINPAVHTIRNKKIVGITKTISYEKHLVRIAKHALGKNYPEKTTYISQNHAVLFQGQMFKAKDLVDNKKVTFVPYNGAILYNVLLEKHEKMQVNNLIVETLHPDHKVAQMYRYLKNIDPAHHGKYIELFNKHDREQRQKNALKLPRV